MGSGLRGLAFRRGRNLQGGVGASGGGVGCLYP